MSIWCKLSMTLRDFKNKFPVLFLLIFTFGKWWSLPRWNLGCGRVDEEHSGAKMSFTVKVKEELLGLGTKSKSELAAIMKMSGSLGIASQGLTLSITTENAKLFVIFMSCF